MDRRSAWDGLVAWTGAMVLDPDSDVVNAEEYEGRWAVRMQQQVRDFTTVWFDVGDLTVGFEAYVLPNPPRGHEAVFRQLMIRNHRMWRTHFSIDRDGDIHLVGRVPLTDWSPGALDAVLGSIYEGVELSFRSLVKTGFGK